MSTILCSVSSSTPLAIPYLILKRLAIACVVCLASLSATGQDKIKMNIDGKEAFTFDSSRIEVLNNEGNLFIGWKAGQFAIPSPDIYSTIGRWNTFLGQEAGSANTTGGQNTFVGSEAGRDVTHGMENTFIGYHAGRVDTAGSYNTMIGAVSGWFNRTGQLNTFVGRASGLSNVAGNGNTFVGGQAGWENTSGNGNTFIGVNAGFANTTDSLSVCIGYRAGESLNRSQALMIDNSATSSPLIYGEFDNDLLRVNGELQVGTAYKFPAIAGSNGQIMRTDGSGQLSWQDDAVDDADANPLNELVDSLKFSFPFLELYEGGMPAQLLDLSTLYEDADADPTNELQSLFTSNDSIIIIDGNKIKIPPALLMKDYDDDTKVELLEGATDSIQFTVDNTMVMEVDVQDGVEVNGPLTTTGIIRSDIRMRVGGSNFGDQLISISNQEINALEWVMSGADVRDLWLQTADWFGDHGDVRIDEGSKLSVGQDQTDPSPTHTITIESQDQQTLRLIGPTSSFGYGGRLNFGDGNRVYLEEPTDDALEIYGQDTISILTSLAGTARVLMNTAKVEISNDLDVGSDMHVSGTLSKASGSFRIDHPLDPENKYLYHSFVESPDMMNIYNGNVSLDQDGKALVTMPEWFVPLNRDFRYQLTAIGAPGPNLHISKPMSGNQFEIAGGAAGMQVSWQVTGIRQDAFANANRIQVEVDKPESERGKYQNPEAFGLPPKADVHPQHPVAAKGNQ